MWVQFAVAAASCYIVSPQTSAFRAASEQILEYILLWVAVYPFCYVHKDPAIDPAFDFILFHEIDYTFPRGWHEQVVKSVI